MTESKDYRLVLESEFKRVHETLNVIKEQTIKTNNRVSHLEDTVVDLRIKEVEHVKNCPVAPDVKQIKDDLLEYKFFKTYPKLLIGLIAVIVIVIIFNIYNSKHIPDRIMDGQEQFKNEMKNEIRGIEGISKVTRGGYVKYNDSGLSDSIKIR